MSMEISRQDYVGFLNKADIIDWNRVIGHTITAYDDNDQPVRVEVERIAPNVMRPWKMEVNGKYLVSVLELAAHLNGEKIPRETIKMMDEFWSRAEVTPKHSSSLTNLNLNRHERRKIFSFLKGLRKR